MTSRHWKKLTVSLTISLGLVAVMAACVAPAAYGPRLPGRMTGYTDRELAPNRYRVTFTGNSVTPRETVEDYLLLRAAEVTLAAGGSHFIFDSRDTRARTRIDADTLGGPPYGGSFGYWGFRPRWGYDPLGPEVIITQTTQYEAFAEIIVLAAGQQQDERRAIDARAIIDHLSPPMPRRSI